MPATGAGPVLELLGAEYTLSALLLPGSTTWLVVSGARGEGPGAVVVVVVVVEVVVVVAMGDGDEGVAVVRLDLVPVNTRPFCLHTFSAVSKRAAAR